VYPTGLPAPGSLPGTSRPVPGSPARAAGFVYFWGRVRGVGPCPAKLGGGGDSWLLGPWGGSKEDFKMTAQPRFLLLCFFVLGASALPWAASRPATRNRHRRGLPRKHKRNVSPAAMPNCPTSNAGLPRLPADRPAPGQTPPPAYPPERPEHCRQKPGPPSQKWPLTAKCQIPPDHPKTELSLEPPVPDHVNGSSGGKGRKKGLFSQHKATTLMGSRRKWL